MKVTIISAIPIVSGCFMIRSITIPGTMTHGITTHGVIADGTTGLIMILSIMDILTAVGASPWAGDGDTQT